jgi:N-acetylglucosamine-6-phosphate deacetylase
MISRYISGRDAVSGKPLQIGVEEGEIRSLASAPSEEAVWISPGLIDLQVNGYGGCDLNAPTVDADVVIALTRKLFATGVTTYLPTLVTASEEQIEKSLRAVAAARQADALVAHAIPFVFVEGPHISPEDGPRGAHPREYVRAPDLSEFERWQAVSGNLVGMVTVSPHWMNALEYIAALAAKGILVAIGHTHATPDQIHLAADAGATLSTHLGNGVGSRLARHPNLIWAQLADDRLTATFIADGHHLPADTLKSMVRAKGVERSVFVSDAVMLCGMASGIYQASIGGRVELRSDGRLSIVDTTTLAGAVSPLKDGIAQAAISGVCGLGDAVRMSTENPGRFVGHRGLLRPGARADLVRFTLDVETRKLQILSVLIDGVEWPMENAPGV